MRSGGVAGGWLRVWRPRPSARVRLVCLPPAGGSAAFYQPWAALLPPYVELVAVEPPGHGTRYAEPFATSFDEVRDGVTRAVERLPDRPTAVYGHSMGSVPALEIARALTRGGPPPVALVVSSRDAPSVAAPEQTDLTALEDDALLAVLGGLGGMDERALADRRLMDAVLPVLRADVALLAGYRYRGGPPLECPVRVYAGASDTATTATGLAAWRRENPRDFRLHRLPGGHFFFRGRERPYLARLAADLTRAALGEPGATVTGP
ncbi:thioesterase [Streptomyces roseirectus]|uniref:Thioesterase n=1 Tax=Streptomyces roseirectus TaxID=2768066 RepID=A0A7H0I6C2_9ACTN|nr:alpha/beta fold hydrolase [Streptomyces roseirectus]QNP68338.1 thioesterase [Streptomyces roseirectus]